MDRRLTWQHDRRAEGRCASCARKRGDCPSTWYCWTCLVWRRALQRRHRRPGPRGARPFERRVRPPLKTESRGAERHG